jgi:hypothetical protein
VVRNLFENIKDELNYIKELFDSTLTHWNGQKLLGSTNFCLKNTPKAPWTLNLQNKWLETQLEALEMN